MPFKTGGRDRWMITDAPCIQAAIFETAHISAVKHNKCGRCKDEFGSYSGSYKNCGAWVRYIIEKGGGTWPSELSSALNLGGGVGKGDPAGMPGYLAGMGLYGLLKNTELFAREELDGSVSYGVEFKISIP